jgi:hypothetical protein
MHQTQGDFSAGFAGSTTHAMQPSNSNRILSNPCILSRARTLHFADILSASGPAKTADTQAADNINTTIDFIAGIPMR